MKHFPAILFIAAAVLYGSVSAPAQAAPILDFAVRVGCDFQQPEKGLMDLHVLQGSTPLVLAMPKAGNTLWTPSARSSDLGSSRISSRCVPYRRPRPPATTFPRWWLVWRCSKTPWLPCLGTPRQGK